MKHIDTTATSIRKIKTAAKKIKLEQGITLSESLEIAAKQAGYDNYHHVTTCEANTKKNKTNKLLGCLKIFEYEGSFCFDVENNDALYIVSEELDDTVDVVGGGLGDMTMISHEGLDLIASLCKKLIEKEPAFLDGYAHWVGALVAKQDYKEALSIGLPALEAAFDLLPPVEQEFQVSYYELSNRPFFRLTHNLVLAYYGENKKAEAKKLAKKMLKLSPNDNMGFRFLLKDPNAV